MIVNYVIVGLVSGLLSAYGMYLLCTDKERRSYEEVINRLTNAETFVADEYRKLYRDLYTANKDLRNLKQWCYGYVSYLPRKERDEQKDKQSSTPVQERVSSEDRVSEPDGLSEAETSGTGNEV